MEIELRKLFHFIRSLYAVTYFSRNSLPKKISILFVNGANFHWQFDLNKRVSVEKSKGVGYNIQTIIYKGMLFVRVLNWHSSFAPYTAALLSFLIYPYDRLTHWALIFSHIEENSSRYQLKPSVQFFTCSKISKLSSQYRMSLRGWLNIRLL